MSYTLPIEKITKDDVEKVGKKALSLAQMHAADIPVPNGYAITTTAWQQFLQSGNLVQTLERELTLLDQLDPLSIQRASQAIQYHIKSHPIPKEVTNEIFDAYEKIDGRLKMPEVAVRISPTNKTCHLDQDPLFLNIRGEASVLDAVKNTWADMYNPITLQKCDKPFEIETAVIIQKMVPATISGVLHTLDTRTEDKQHYTIEAIWGIGEYLAQNYVKPDRYIINKDTLEIVKKEVNKQDIYLTKVLSQTQERKVDKQKQTRPKLKDEQVKQLADYTKQIRKLHFYHQTAEWVFTDDKFYFVETQPYADYEEKDRFYQHPLADGTEASINLPVLAEGIGVSPGISVGRIHRIHHPSEIADLDKQDIMLVSKFEPQYYPAIRKVSGIISESDGTSSPVAVMAREIGLPTVLGAKDASNIKSNQLVTVNGKHGIVYNGKADLSSEDMSFSRSEFVGSHQLLSTPPDILPSTKTATKIYVQLPTATFTSIHNTDIADGVTQIKGEYLLTQLPQHPSEYFKYKKEKHLIDRIYRKLLSVSQKFEDKEVFYHFSDINTILAKELLEGHLYEPEETNPLLGYRGSFRHLFNRELLRAEIQAVKKVREDCKNLNVVIPLVRSTSELKHMFKILKVHDLVPSENLKIYLSVSTPANLIVVAEYAKLGVKGIIIDLAELTKFMLGVDPANAEVAPIYNQMDSSVLWLLKHSISYCNNNDIITILSGTTPGKFPDFTSILIKAGLSGISVPPDLLHAAKRFAVRAEQNLLNN